MEVSPENLKAIGVSDHIVSRHLTGILHLIKSLSDMETALAFAWKYGGRQIYIPTKVSPVSGLYNDLNEKAFQAIVDLHATDKVVVPQGPFSAKLFLRFRALKMLEQGETYNAIAEAMRVSRAVVRQWREFYFDDETGRAA